jgi:hypothetical protein
MPHVHAGPGAGQDAVTRQDCNRQLPVPGECLYGAGTCRARLRSGGGAEITRQKTITLDTGLPGVRRVRRRLPVEYPSEDEPQEPQPFDQAAVNPALAGILRS